MNYYKEKTKYSSRVACIFISQINQFRSSLLLLRNELLFRRRFMLADLYKIYFVDDYLIRYFKRTCSCTKYDLIAGIHLPASERAGNFWRFGAYF